MDEPLRPLSTQQRAYLSPQHLFATYVFAKLTYDIEESNEADRQAKHRSYVIAAILSAVCYMEAAINEVYLDAVDANLHTIYGLTEEQRTALVRMWELGADRLSILEKFEAALLVCGKPPLPPGLEPRQDADSLIQLRNELTHFKPKWIDVNPRDRKRSVPKLESRLRGKFRDSPFYPKPEEVAFFPHRCLSYGCAKWAYEAARAFVDVFAAAMCLKLPMTQPLQPLPRERQSR